MDKIEKKILKNKYLLILTNILLVVFTAIGLWLMFSRRSAASPSEFLAKGFRNFKYFTTLSNVFCGLTAFSYLLALFFAKKEKTGKILNALKIMSSAAVGVTFIVILGFLGPIYGYSRMYRSSNLWFHLLIPIFAKQESRAVIFINIQSLNAAVYRYHLIERTVIVDSRDVYD